MAEWPDAHNCALFPVPFFLEVHEEIRKSGCDEWGGAESRGRFVGPSHCQPFYSLIEALLQRCTGAQLVPKACAIMRSPNESTCTDPVQGQGGRGAGFEWFSDLAVPLRKYFLCDRALYGTCIQIYGTTMCRSWIGFGRLKCPTTCDGRNYQSNQSPLFMAHLHLSSKSTFKLSPFSFSNCLTEVNTWFSSNFLKLSS